VVTPEARVSLAMRARSSSLNWPTDWVSRRRRRTRYKAGTCGRVVTTREACSPAGGDAPRGGDGPLDLAILRNQPQLFGEVALTDRLAGDLLRVGSPCDRTATTRAGKLPARLELHPSPVALDFDSTLVTAPLGKGRRRPNYEHGSASIRCSSSSMDRGGARRHAPTGERRREQRI